MQVAGTPCSVCGQRILAARDGGACPKCKQAFHKACLRDPGRCPSCLGDYEEATANERTAALGEREARLAHARVLILFVATVVLGLQIVAVGVLWWLGVEVVAAAESARLVWVAIPFVLLYFGVRLARIWVVASLTVTVLLTVAMTIGHAKAGNGSGAAIGAALAAIYSAALCVVVSSRSISDHLATSSFER